jgi:cytochrome bd-type quinol oxidase subunit 2
MKNKAIKYLLIIFFILFVADLWTTLSVGPTLIYYLESNPIFHCVGIPGIAILNLLAIGLFYWVYNKHSAFQRYILCNILTSACIVRIFVIINNYQVIKNPPTIEMTKAVTPAMKEAAVMKVIAPVFIPFLVGIVAFMFWRLDHDITKKE